MDSARLKSDTAVLQWLKQHLNHGSRFETGVVRALILAPGQEA